MTAPEEYNGLEIAIIGMSARFPESMDHRQFWQNLKDGRELLKTFTDGELRERGVPEALILDKRYIKTTGVIDNKDCFDSSFFGYTPEESSLMDPQVRLFHEYCWHAIEDAGYSSLIERIKIGLFAGASVNENWKLYAYGKSADTSVDPFLLRILASQNFISTLVSYKLDFRGPALYIDTACSTSLTAVHLACRSLLTRECVIALAGGISMTTEKRKGHFYQEGMISSNDGHCRTFDSMASGTAWGEGVGVVALKRLKEAIKDRDHIYAIIKATSANNDGNHKVGYTAPSVKGQAECIMAAQRLAGIEPNSITYIEAHGTGTKLGDPIELKALNESFGSGNRNKFCAIGSVKTNIGHLDSAAGIAGLIKTALSLKYKLIPASLHFKKPNPEIEFDQGPFYVNTELKEWLPENGSRLRAGISSFGIGGTNVHAILERAPEPEEHDSLRAYKLLTISAKTEKSVIRYLNNLSDFLQKDPEVNLADMAYTLQTGRKHFAFRKSIVYRDREELLRLLDEEKSKKTIEKSRERRPVIVFMFPGQGSQYVEMGKGLYLTEPLFREKMDSGFSILENLTGEEFKKILFPDTPGNSRINETRYTQPLLFLIEYSLAHLLISMGISPGYMIGHSIGEYVAACIAGVFSFGDGLRLVLKRGELMNSLPEGAMLSIPITAGKARTYLNESIFLAAINSPEQVVLSGNIASVEDLSGRLKASETPYLRLHTSHAFHSGMQDVILDAFRQEVKEITLNRPSIPFISNLTGTVIREEEAVSPDYWASHLRETVKFSDGVQTLLSRGEEMVFIEVGAGHSLTGLLKQQQTKHVPVTVNLMGSARDKEDDAKYFIGRIGRLWSCGVTIDWNAYYKEEKRRRVSLPAYSFEPTSFPAEVDPFESGRMARFGSAHNKELKDWIYFPSWKRSYASPVKTNAVRKTYLFFSGEAAFSLSLKAELLKEDAELIEIVIGEYRKTSKYQYAIDPTQPDQFERLILELKKDKIGITDIIYAWGMLVDSSGIKWEEGNKGLCLVYFSIVAMMRALVQTGEAKNKKISILTGTLYKVIGTEKVSAAQSLMLGLVNVIPQEYRLPCINIDIDLAEQAKEWAFGLAEEIRNDDALQDRVIALRHGRKWVQDYQKNSLPAERKDRSIENGGIYLITGGLGNVGFVLAKYLIETYQAKVIITGRKRIGGEEGPAPGNNQAEERLEYLKKRSKDVSYFKADVSDFEELKGMVEKVEQSIGTIRGVIHAAGIVDNNYFELIEDISIGKTMKIFAPKIKGIENIYMLFKDRSPDFVWITSSLATVLGGLGYASYSSANLYMDHFVASNSDELAAWKCIGLSELAFSLEQQQGNAAALSPADITGCFEWSLAFKGPPVIMANKEDLPARIGKTYKTKKETPPDSAFAVDRIIRLERPDLSTAYVAPETETEKKLVSIYENLFGIEMIGIEDEFLELGGDSLKGMILVKRVKKEFNISLNLFYFLVNISVRKVAEKIDEMTWFKSDIKTDNEITI